MRQIHILVEGQTEERLVLRVFQRELADRGVWLTPIVLKTSWAPGRPTHWGGVSKWSNK
ncbi:hypothetical protein [Streptomyces sp. NBC_00690]|uniref:hypothetical protein n=1 Tax=Streptomyces sp. NBC_00690 TaxID=2975808 RepID=UPI002E2BF2CC|nr:hypothetical protein [Streptomyces sp. NBC_00690]